MADETRNRNLRNPEDQEAEQAQNRDVPVQPIGATSPDDVVRSEGTEGEQAVDQQEGATDPNQTHPMEIEEDVTRTETTQQ